MWLEQRCRELWDEIHHPEQPQRTVAEVWADERAHLMCMPAPFDGFVEHTKRVSPTCLIAFERNRYSVPASFANRPVSVRVYAERIVIGAEGQVIAEHLRVLARGRDYRPGRTLYELAPLPDRPPTKAGRAEERRSVCRASPTLQTPPGAAAQAPWRGPGDGGEPGAGAAPR